MSLLLLRAITGLGLWLVPHIVSAQEGSSYPSVINRVADNFSIFSQSAGISDQASNQQPEEIVAFIIFRVLGFMGLIFIVLTLYGGFQWMTARGNEDQVENARDIIRNAVIGVAIVFFSFLVTAFVVQQFGEAAFTPSQSGIISL